MKFKKETGKFVLFINKLTIEIYHPYILKRVGRNYTGNDKPYGQEFGTKTEIGLFAPTTMFYTKPRDGWSWDKAFVARILGIGFGASWKHCDNPYVKESL